ncbi:diaminopimelate epimerase [Methanoregula sp. UBA64]|jgi:diaminopimelate epimerase|uniref:diaminopimelate epimerase n=1 Tax=Methanoregula sp. UBA64 TaxID=1915554 RepID=UPI0025EE21A8|nr:diaminopimelate epimerase [Methanoregula sp. UBA64]
MEIPFTKLHGNGNDFVLIDEYNGTVIPDEMKGQFAALYCDRRFGIGADGILFLSKPTKTADIRMRIFQPDESEAEMCGNGIRCLAKYAYDAGYVRETCTVQTETGVLPVTLRYAKEEFFATIGMGEPKFIRNEIPATGNGEYCEKIGEFTVFAANTGVPHAVVLVDVVDGVDIAVAAPPIRHHRTFLHGANVNFVQKTGDDSIRIRTFERGVEDETLSCGTGATASAAIVHHLGYMKGPVKVDTKGGPLTISFGPDGAKMEGPAATVFSGSIPF